MSLRRSRENLPYCILIKKWEITTLITFARNDEWFYNIKAYNSHFLVDDTYKQMERRAIVEKLQNEKTTCCISISEKSRCNLCILW